ncbi:protoporphyrinogen oxidase [Nonlabens marinus]|uniref:Coproporphyrinogen III oxidase n=1 Tax=Nonlabens marinus S1-08 TaxID=1454201 RepID=W8W045_9FLAO|nr:protoporphyrinogen oxidase [Nonlabens marinus]BAO55686.1 protoporphyrinogen IX oxidase, aerobic, HemY [Nonlabens marinus S1-08]
MQLKDSYDYVVLGAGLSGLSTGHALQSRGLDFIVLEATQRAGGVIESSFTDGFVVESGANSMILTPTVAQLCEDLGISNQIINAREESKVRQILWGDQLHTLKASPLTLLTTQILSFTAKLRILKEPFIKSSSPDGETVLDFFTRRFGSQVAQRLAGAIVSGIYAGDPSKLEMASVFPRFVALEIEYGSLLKGLKKSPAAPRKIVSFKDGMETLPSTLSRKLQDHICYEYQISSIYKNAESWIIKKKNGDFIRAGHIISTLPSYALESIMKTASFPKLEITYNPMWTIQVKVNRSELESKTIGFGFLASMYERKDFIGTLYNGNTFTTGLTGKYALITFFVRPDHCEHKSITDVLERLCIPYLRKWTGIEGPIELVHSKKWPHAIPQKEVGHRKLIEKIQSWETENPNFSTAGNFIYGVSLGDCVEAHQKLVSSITSNQPS